MREAIGHALLLQLIVTFLFAVMLVFTGSVSYSKAYKLKNRIINIIEENKGYNSEAQEEIDEVLSNVGYQISNGIANCQKKTNAIDMYPGPYNSNGYKYCVVKYEDSKGREYYGVTTFMSFQFPIVNNIMEFPVYGESKTIGILD